MLIYRQSFRFVKTKEGVSFCDWPVYMTDQDRVKCFKELGHSLCFDKHIYNAYILFENLLTAMCCVWDKILCGIVKLQGYVYIAVYRRIDAVSSALFLAQH